MRTEIETEFQFVVEGTRFCLPGDTDTIFIKISEVFSGTRQNVNNNAVTLNTQHRGALRFFVGQQRIIVKGKEMIT